MYSAIIKNGTIIDGTGKEKYQADLGIKDDLIAKIKPKIRGKAEIEIDAAGLYVCPGFIDIFNHSDDYWTLFTILSQESLLYQGITTILGGNAGSSLAPLINPHVIERIRQWANVPDVMVNWQRMDEYLKELAKRKIALNFASLVGYETLYYGLAGDSWRTLQPREVVALASVLKEALHQGAFGLSTGLSFSQANFISKQTLETIVKIVAEAGGIYAIHVRGEREELLPSIHQAIEIARLTGVSLQINHLKALGKKTWPLMLEALQLIDQAKKDKININFDIYPYTTTASSLLVLLPDWLAEGDNETILNRLQDPVIKARAIHEMKQEVYNYDKITIAQSKNQCPAVGKSLKDIAINENCSPEQAVCNMLLANEAQVIVFIQGLSEANFEKALVHPLALIGTDGLGYNLEFAKRGVLVHPRSFGAFARILARYVREKKIVSWEEAIYKMTMGPARKIGLKKRGQLALGNFADIVVFDPQTIQDRATFDNPFQYAVGIKHLLINGQAVIENGQYNGRFLGRILSKSRH